MLVIERSQFVSAPGKLCFPGGEIEPGESEPEAVRRELKEELNLQVEPLRRIWRSETLAGVELSWWLTEIVGDPVPEPNTEEVASYTWMSRSEMVSHPKMLSSNQQFLKGVSVDLLS